MTKCDKLLHLTSHLVRIWQVADHPPRHYLVTWPGLWRLPDSDTQHSYPLIFYVRFRKSIRQPTAWAVLSRSAAFQFLSLFRWFQSNVGNIVLMVSMRVNKVSTLHLSLSVIRKTCEMKFFVVFSSLELSLGFLLKFKTCDLLSECFHFQSHAENLWFWVSINTCTDSFFLGEIKNFSCHLGCLSRNVSPRCVFFISVSPERTGWFSWRTFHLFWLELAESDFGEEEDIFECFRCCAGQPWYLTVSRQKEGTSALFSNWNCAH